jgi:hypothetical protein
MSGNSLVVEQAPPLAQPTEHAKQAELDAEIIDLDAGESLLDGKPDDGKDTTGDEASPGEETPEPKVEEPAKEDGDSEEEDDDPVIAALTAEPEKPEKPPSGSARLKAKLAEAHAEIERLRKSVPQVDEAASLAAAVEREIGPPPKESDFQDYLAFQKAETAWATANMLVTRELKKNAEAVKRATEERNNAIVDEFRGRAQEVRKIVKDFDAVIGAASVSPSNPEVAMAILESDRGPHIAYYLAKNPSKVHEINSLPLRRALAEVGRLEARLTPSPKKETKAPAPVPPVKGGMRTTEVDPEKLSQDEFNKWFDDRKRRMGG